MSDYTREQMAEACRKTAFAFRTLCEQLSQMDDAIQQKEADENSTLLESAAAYIESERPWNVVGMFTREEVDDITYRAVEAEFEKCCGYACWWCSLTGPPAEVDDNGFWWHDEPGSARRLAHENPLPAGRPETFAGTGDKVVVHHCTAQRLREQHGAKPLARE